MIIEDKTTKRFISKDYNYIFDKVSGFFARWGKTKNDDPKFAESGPEIADIEISTVCSGINGVPCRHCYKSNTKIGKNMGFETFKIIFHKLGKQLTQIAFGIGDVDANPDMFKIMEYCRTNGVIPNVTINGDRLTSEIAQQLSKVCGAIAVSYYGNKDVCYNAIKTLTDLGMKQINIHCLVSQETEQNCYDVMDDFKHDSRLEKMNAIVFLRLKEKGRGEAYHQLSLAKFMLLIHTALENNVRVGFDSCGAPVFLQAVKDRPDFKRLEQLAESCESSIFSSYINTDGVYFPCSFSEGIYEGIDVVKCDNFLKDVWYAPKTIEFRNKLLCQKHEISATCRKCPIYNLE